MRFVITSQVPVLLRHLQNWLGLWKGLAGRGDERYRTLNALCEKLTANLPPQEFSNRWGNGISDLSMARSIVPDYHVIIWDGL
jgi:hypothetical protein